VTSRCSQLSKLSRYLVLASPHHRATARTPIMPPSRSTSVCVIRTFLYQMSSKMRSGFEESRWFSGLDKWLLFGRRATVRSLDIGIQGSATTPCNPHAWVTIRQGARSARRALHRLFFTEYVSATHPASA
jgi:hypothetical protein